MANGAIFSIFSKLCCCLISLISIHTSRLLSVCRHIFSTCLSLRIICLAWYETAVVIGDSKGVVSRSSGRTIRLRSSPQKACVLVRGSLSVRLSIIVTLSRSSVLAYALWCSDVTTRVVLVACVSGSACLGHSKTIVCILWVGPFDDCHVDPVGHLVAILLVLGALGTVRGGADLTEQRTWFCFVGRCRTAWVVSGCCYPTYLSCSHVLYRLIYFYLSCDQNECRELSIFNGSLFVSIRLKFKSKTWVIEGN